MPSPAIKPLLRVAHVVLQLDIGGMEKLLVDFARHADRRRFDLRFLSLSGRGALAEEIEASAWPVTALNEPPGLRPTLVWRLASLFRRWKVDVVHTHNTKPLLYAGPAARLARIPTVLHTCHGQQSGASLRRTTLFVLACRSADRVICVSQAAAALRAREGVPPRHIRAIWNGIDLARFLYCGPQPGGPTALVARLTPEKDVGTLLRATSLVVQRDPSFRLEIAGDGECGPALRQLTTELKLERHVRFLGTVRDVAPLLGRARLFVLPSLTEGISLSLLEAMAHGLPVIATRVGGNAEVIRPDETGLLVPPRAPAELADAILRVVTDPDLGRRLGLAGRRRVEEHFNVRTMVARYEALYDELGRPAPREPRGRPAGLAT